MAPPTPSGGEALRPAPWFALWANPVAQRCRRARLRPKHILTYGLLGFTITAFVFLVVYLPALRRFEATPQVAAKATLLPLLIMQGIALMGLGTAAIASGIARERDRDLLDYQRMTPMSPTAKILGYLFGLPAREYFLFAITIPFVAFALWHAELPALKIVKYYVVFFSAVWVYHLTGLCAGVVSKKPWQASVISLGSVVGLYLVLPQLSYAGLAFFDFLTVRPTFYNVIAEELNPQDRGFYGAEWIRQYGDQAFFMFSVPPTLFSLAVQAFALASLFTVIHRKWVDPGRHPFSKVQGVAFLLGVLLLLVGTLWPTLADEAALRALSRRINAGPSSHAMGWLLGLYVAVAGVVTLLVSQWMTPQKHTARQGLRRALRLGRANTPLAWDAAPALRWVIVLSALTLTGYAALALVAVNNTAAFAPTVDLPWRCLIAPMLILLPACFFVHGVSERYGLRAMLLTLFVLWAIPVMVSVVFTASAREASEVAAAWIAAPSPLTVGVLSFLLLVQEADANALMAGLIVDGDLRAQSPWIIGLHVVGYTALAAWVQWRRRVWARRWFEAESAAFAANDQPSPGGVVSGTASDGDSMQPTGNAQ